MRRLLIRPGAIGDVIVSLPALEALRADYTEVWTHTHNLPLIRFANRVRAISSTGLDLLEIPGAQAPPGLPETLQEFDDIVSWYGTGREEFRHAVRRLGLPFRFLRALPPEHCADHAADFYLKQAVSLGSDARFPAVPRIPVPRWEGGFVVIHPFSGSTRKNWALEKFREVASRLANLATICWCAGPEEEFDGAQRFASLGDLAEWLAGASLFIGNDSGIAHLAAAVGTPVVAVFGPTNPAVWAPRGAPVRIVLPEPREAPLSSIPVDAVEQAARSMLTGHIRGDGAEPGRD